MLLGNPNKIINKIGTSLMLDDRISKLLYYSDKDGFDLIDVDSLEKIDNPIDTLKDNYVFFNKRVERIFQKGGSAMFIRVGEFGIDNSNKFTGGIDTMEIEIGIVCHINYLETLNGNRLFCIIDSIQNVLREYMEVGNIKFIRALPIRDLPLEYEGYILFLEVNDYNEHGLNK